jgi:hypothetical protein
MTTTKAGWFYAALGLAAALVSAGGVQAATVTYEIHVDTSSISTTVGYLDFQFDPGDTPYDPATATIYGFSTDGTLGTALPNLGDVTGALPDPVIIANSDLPNEYTPGFTFGSFFDVFVTLDIPSLSGMETGGNTFSLDAQDSGNNPLLSSGAPLVVIDLDALTGDPTPINNSTNSQASIAATPEPAPLVLLAMGLIGVRIAMRRQFFRVAGRG